MLTPLAMMAAAVAQQGPANAAQPLPQQVRALRECRVIADTSARLACYDTAAAALDQAVASRSVVVLGAEDVRRTKRSLFGFSLPRLPFLGSGKDGDSAEEREIESTIASASEGAYGRWRVRLEEGGVWETTEAASGSNEPFAGAKVRIRRAALGSYLMNVGRSRALRVRRVS